MRHYFLIIATVVLGASSYAQSTTPRDEVRRMMGEQPDVSWPRGLGHVVLAWPGSRLEQKGYHEPGGSFSPSPGSFGIQIAVRDGQGQIVGTSDSIDMTKLQQTWLLSEGQPAVETTTEFYRTRWRAAEPGKFSLALTPKTKGGNRIIVVVRSVGPAGGPIRSLRHKGYSLSVNERWEITVPQNTEGIQVLASAEDDWNGAEISVPPTGEWKMTISDSHPAPPSPIPAGPLAISTNLPDTRFNAALTAQVFHLKAGLTGDETRPGEPVNYPLTWLRDGTYTLTALATAGELETARVLARLFAERDFFGGFGPEADAPGLALSALEEVALRLRDPKFDQFLWPHVVRKAGFILAMREAKAPIRGIAFGPIVPGRLTDPNLTLICDAARDGLIIGRMDHHRPLLFVNAVSYRGLLSAAEVADRLADPVRAKRWRSAAAELRAAWWKTFGVDKERKNERTAISGLWPTWIAADDPARYREAVPVGMGPKPLWTYFDVARAHQWLYLNQPQETWNILNWFLDHQASPGLYSWWEGEGEENSFGLWPNIRGWINPIHVTPHYWTAAEMLSLQLDMLAYVDLSKDQPELVIGAGVPKEWVKKTMEVRGVVTRLGKVDWTWRAGKTSVLVDGKPAKARIAFE